MFDGLLTFNIYFARDKNIRLNANDALLREVLLAVVEAQFKNGHRDVEDDAAERKCPLTHAALDFAEGLTEIATMGRRDRRGEFPMIILRRARAT